MLNPKSKNVHERAYDFSVDIINFANNFPNKKVYWIIADQLIRSATSIAANLRESKGSISSKDFINFFHIALKSNNETCYWLEICRDSSLDIHEESNKLLGECEEIGKMIGASLITLKKNELKRF